MNRHEKHANPAPSGVPSHGEHSAEDPLYELLVDDLSPEDWDTPQLPSFTAG